MEPMDTVEVIEPQRVLTRSYDFEVTRTAPDKQSDGLTMEGYAAVFNEATRIDSWEGRFDETIERGAFGKSIAERMPVLQFDHGSHPLVGSLPLGVISQIREDAKGLFVRARLAANWLVEPVREAIESGAVKGMSFRFNVIRDDWNYDGSTPLRTLKEIVVPELGPVVFPAYSGTSVGVRSAQLSELLKDDKVLADLARLLTFPAETSAAPDKGTPVEANDTPPIEAPVGNEKREQLLREAARMDRLTAAAMRVTL